MAEDTLRNIEGVEGGYGHDELTGDDKDNWLLGGAGDDHLDGRNGNDTLSGGVGADRFVYGSAAETVGDVITDFKAGEDLIDLSEVGRFALLGDSPQAKSLWTVRDGKDLLLRGDTDGDATTAEVDLRLKNVASLGAADIKFQLDPVVSVTDVITETEAVPVAEAVQGLVIDLGQQPEVADASGNAGDDTLTGNGGDNRLDGGAGDDRLFGKGGDDTLDGGYGKDMIDGGDGIDTVDYSWCPGSLEIALIPAQSSIILVDGKEEDSLRNIENIIGGFGDDTLTGDDKANILRGGEGDDTLVGGGGADRFVYTPDSFGDDVILDFDAAGGDRIDLAMKTATGTGLSWNPDGPQAWSVWMEKGNDGVVLYADIDGNADTDFSITLRGVTDLDQSALIL